MENFDGLIKKHKKNSFYCVEKSKWLRQDCNVAFKTVKCEADMDEPLSLALLGDCYYYGYGTEINYKSAVQCYEKAFAYRKSSNNRDIIEYKMYELGLCYEHGRGTENDKQAAMECFAISAEAGNIYAMYACGDLYAIQFDNFEKAVEYYNLAVDVYNNSEQRDEYADYFEKMKYILECYNSAVNGENMMVELGDYYTGYVEKYKQDYVYHEGYREEYTYRIVEGFHNTIDGKKGFAWYRKANSRYRLACCYYEGVGTEKNWAKAVEIFQSYANSTEFEHYAANALCHCYSTGGYGVEKNFLKAARWLLKL